MFPNYYDLVKREAWGALSPVNALFSQENPVSVTDNGQNKIPG